MLQVSDGSTIEVYPNSQLVFRKNTGDWKDLLDLIIGDHSRAHRTSWEISRIRTAS